MEYSRQDHARDEEFVVQVHTAGPFDSEGNVRCYKHQLLAQLRTSNTEKNPEREFYSCAKEFSDPDRCNFFLWADEIASPKLNGDNEESPAQCSPPTWADSPRSSQGSAQSVLLSSSQPIASWDALNASDTPECSSPTLFGSIYPTSSRSNSLPPDTNGPDSGEHATLGAAIPSDNSNASFEEEYLWNALHNFSETDNGSPPPMPPFQHNPVRSHVDSADHLRRHPDEAATWNAPLPSTDVFGRAFSQLTPPSSIPDKTAAANTPGMMKKDFQKPSNFATGTILTDAALSSSRAGGVTGRRRKLSSQGATYSRNSAAPARWRAKQTSATSPRRNATPLVVPSHSQPAPAAVPGLTLSGDAVASHLDALSHLPECIRKLERKQAAAEKSIRMKTKRIAELEEEVRRLASENAHLLKTRRSPTTL